jgi:hypothetical protein
VSDSLFVALVSNVSLLVAMIFVYDLVNTGQLRLETRLHQIIVGLSLSVIAIAVLATPWALESSIFLDARSVLIGISGLFFGAVPTVIVMVLASAYQMLQGGPSTLMGICVIVASGLIGLAWRYAFKRPLATLTWGNLLGLGYVVHVVMLALVFTLPLQTG